MSRSPLFHSVEPRHRVFRKVPHPDLNIRFPRAGNRVPLPEADAEAGDPRSTPEFSISIG